VRAATGWTVYPPRFRKVGNPGGARYHRPQCRRRRFRQRASYGLLFWAVREWLVASLIVERLYVDKPYLERLNAAKFELAAP